MLNDIKMGSLKDKINKQEQEREQKLENEKNLEASNIEIKGRNERIIRKKNNERK